MQRALRPSALIPPGFDVESAVCDGATTVITVRPRSDRSLCPGCGASSGRIHSRYQRCLTDLPLAGRPVRLVVVARRFRCFTVMCSRRISPSGSMTGLWRPGRGEHHQRQGRHQRCDYNILV
ncbi:transposase family protein [Bradyrhizobium sp. LB13.1]